jgi:hypothetical protein
MTVPSTPRGAPRPPGSKRCPKLILEGTRLTHKTDLAFALNEHEAVVGPRRYRYHSPLISAEWCTFSPYPWGHGPIDYEPADEARAMAVYATWLRMFGLQRFYSWIIDRFHLSTRACQITAGRRDPDFGWLEAGLDVLGFRLILCTRREETFEAARAERLKVSGKPSQYDDLSLFIREQALLRRLAEGSSLMSLEVDMSDGDTDRASREIAAWLEATGGMWCYPDDPDPLAAEFERRPGADPPVIG